MGVLKATIDTNVIIDEKELGVIDRIQKLAEQGKIDIAVTTRVYADKDRDRDERRKAKHLKELQDFPSIGTVGRYGLSRYNSGDFYGGSQTEKLEKQLERIIWGQTKPNDKRRLNKLADIDHLIGHLLAGRDVFVTRDGSILRKSDKLKGQLGMTVETPEELLSRFERQ